MVLLKSGIWVQNAGFGVKKYVWGHFVGRKWVKKVILGYFRSFQVILAYFKFMVILGHFRSFFGKNVILDHF